MPERRDLFLAIVLPYGARDERVFEIGTELADFLARLTEWQPCGTTIDGLSQLLELELVDGR